MENEAFDANNPLALNVQKLKDEIERILTAEQNRDFIFTNFIDKDTIDISAIDMNPE